MSRILVAAGTDSSGGAGMSRDIAMAESLNCSVAPVVTAVTVQTNRALIDIQPISPERIAAQVKAAFDPGDQPPKAIKIGMIGSPLRRERGQLDGEVAPEIRNGAGTAGLCGRVLRRGPLAARAVP